MIKSVSYDQSEILRNILELHVPGKRIDLDCTYSKGNFYKGTGIEKPALRFDIRPLDSSVAYGDARKLPVADGSIRRRFRMYIWKQWKKPKTKVANLRKLGIPADRAYQWGNSRLGY